MSDRRAVYTVREAKDGAGKGFWCRIGTCFTNRDGSFSVLLDALPANGKLIIQDEKPRDENAPRRTNDRRDAPANDADPDLPF